MNLHEPFRKKITKFAHDMPMFHHPFRKFTLNLRGRLFEVDRPAVMGILNVTPDSFYAGSRAESDNAIERRVACMMAEGADMIDIGAYSSRPGASDVSAQEEIERLSRGMAALRRVAPEVPVSVDTFRADVARAAVEEMGADMVNDISGGDLDPGMADTVATLKVPYIVMHMRGTPATMQTLTDYPDGVTAEVIADLSRKIDSLRLKGVADIIADPGLGFAKTIDQNYELLRHTGDIADMLDTPVLIGLSRKSMFTRALGISAADSLPATVAGNTIALASGAAIVRVHDVAAAVQAREVTALTFSQTSTTD